MALRAPPCGVTASDPSFLAGPVRFAAVDPDRWRLDPTEATRAAGFRFGPGGAHLSRTFMLAEAVELFAAVPPDASASVCREAIVRENVLGKPTAIARQKAGDALRSLYACDPSVPLYRVLRRLWNRDRAGRPLLALLAALTRDPILRATAPSILDLHPGAQLPARHPAAAIRRATGDRMSDSTVVAAAQRSRATWTRAGHLAGRARKVRRRVDPTPGALALAVWLGEREGLGGEALLESRWAEVLDRPLDELTAVAHQAHRLELVDLRAGGGIFDLRTRSLDPGENPAP